MNEKWKTGKRRLEASGTRVRFGKKVGGTAWIKERSSRP